MNFRLLFKILILFGLAFAPIKIILDIRSSFNSSIQGSLDRVSAQLPKDLSKIITNEFVLSSSNNAERQMFPVDAFCGWLAKTGDALGVNANSRWINGLAPENYAALVIPENNDEYCQDGNKPENKLYVYIKITLAKESKGKAIHLTILESQNSLKLLITAYRNNDELKFVTHTPNGQVNSIHINPSLAPGFFNYSTATDSFGKITAHARLVIRAISDEARKPWTLRGESMEGEFRNPLSILVRTDRLLETFSTFTERSLEPCMSVSSDTNYFKPVYSPCDNKGFSSALLSTARFFLDSTTTKKRSVILNGLPATIQANGDEILIMWINIFGFLFLLTTLIFAILLIWRWRVSRGLRNRVREIVMALRSARANPSFSPDIPYLKDDELGDLASSARDAILSERKAEVNQRIERARAQAHEDYAYCLRHELRNFVSSVSASGNHELISRAKLASSLIDSIDDVAARRPLSNLDAGEGIVILFSELIKQWTDFIDRSLLAQLSHEEVPIKRSNYRVKCIPSLVCQVLNKYLENAFEHRSEGSPVTVITGEADGFVGIALTNNKPELDSEIAERLFRPSHTLEDFNGEERMRGVGLYAAREYAISTGGYVSCEVRYPEVQFWIYLQIAGEVD